MNNEKRILIIDDEEVILFGFSMVLQEPGVVVDCAATINEAKKLIATHAYNAALIDLRLSDSTEMEGFECIRFLRVSQHECKIIVLTAYGDSKLKVQAKALGGDLFYEKPTEPNTIREALTAFSIYKA